MKVRRASGVYWEAHTRTRRSRPSSPCLPGLPRGPCGGSPGGTPTQYPEVSPWDQISRDHLRDPPGNLKFRRICWRHACCCDGATGGDTAAHCSAGQTSLDKQAEDTGRGDPMGFPRAPSVSKESLARCLKLRQAVLAATVAMHAAGASRSWHSAIWLFLTGLS